eukprot:GHVS01025290.1.p1 GENE.GHVS01025290.1~~GHVS01025290.1.p1  ORF type:complete len:118 (-),score=5.46 GHVS01025290.1:130-483(-)
MYNHVPIRYVHGLTHMGTHVRSYDQKIQVVDINNSCINRGSLLESGSTTTSGALRPLLARMSCDGEQVIGVTSCYITSLWYIYLMLTSVHTLYMSARVLQVCCNNECSSLLFFVCSR